MRLKHGAGQSESILLIRSMKKEFTGELEARSGFCRWTRSYTRYWAEFRDTAILLYPLPDGSTSVTSPRSPNESNGSAGNETRTETSQEFEDHLANVSPGNVIIVALREASLKVRENVLTITVKRPDRSGAIQLRFDDTERFKLWRARIEGAVSKRKVTLADFEIIRHIGKGASGRVYLVKDVRTEEELALKVIEKTSVVESADAFRHALDERIVLEQACKHPFVLDMRSAFQNKKRLFIVTEYCPGGDLFEFLTKLGKPMSEEKARTVVGEILLALEHIHTLGVVYRDLKLENVLLDNDGHVRLADFGLAKSLRDADGTLKRTKTFCGTREYVAPEMIKEVEYDFSVDYWTVGILLYEVLCGRTPFFSDNRNEIYPRIEKAPVFYPRELSEEVKSLLGGLLERNPSKRLGANGGISVIKKHRWFNSLDWDAIARREKSPLAETLRWIQSGKEAVYDDDDSNVGKNKRKVEQEKAFKSLLADAAADHASIGPSEETSDVPTTPLGKGMPRKPRKKVPILAGYSFVAQELSMDDNDADVQSPVSDVNSLDHSAPLQPAVEESEKQPSGLVS